MKFGLFFLLYPLVDDQEESVRIAVGTLVDMGNSNNNQFVPSSSFP